MRTDKRERVKIGYKDFDILFVKRFQDGDQIGECEFPLRKRDNSKGKIRIKKGQDGIEKANTIVHELLHAIAYVKGIGLDAETEERVVCAFTNGLIGIILDNPAFTMRLLKLLRQKPKPTKKARKNLGSR